MALKILYITNKISPPGGLERVLALKTSSLADDFSYEVHIITLNQGNESVFHHFSPRIHMHDLRVAGTGLSKLWQYVSQIRAKVAEIRPDVIDVCDDGLKGFFIPVLLQFRYPLVYERHVSKTIEYNAERIGALQKMAIRVKYLIMNILARTFDAFVVLTEGNTREWNLPNMMVIGNPLTFYPEQVSSLENKVVMAAGRHVYQKGFELLLEAWAHIHHQFPDWKLKIYGKPESGVDLFDYRAKLKLESSVELIPPVQDIDQKYLEASVYALSSRFEGFGMVLTEAMACGVPCVSFDCPCGPSDIISHEQDGLLVSNGDIKALANGLALLMANQELRKQMGQMARQSVLRYSKNATMQIWSRLFTQLSSKKRR